MRASAEKTQKGKESDAHDVVSDSSTEDDDPDAVLKELKFGEDASEDGESGDGAVALWLAGRLDSNGEKRDSLGSADKQQERPKLDLVLVHEAIVDPHAHCGSHRKRDDHPKRRDGSRRANVAAEEGEVDLESYEEEKQDETDGGDEVEEGDRGGGEDVRGESGDATCEVVSRKSARRGGGRTKR